MTNTNTAVLSNERVMDIIIIGCTLWCRRSIAAAAAAAAGGFRIGRRHRQVMDSLES